MKKLTPYENKQEEHLKNIYNSKKATTKIKKENSEEEEEIKLSDTISSIYPSIINSYEDYYSKKTNLENINDSFCNDIQKKALIHCYENSTKELGIVKGKILDNQPQEVGKSCQFCGINSANTFDHYVPKSNYPEFSVYAPNLIPACGECNSLKNDIWFNQYRYFLNLYYDEIPDKVILQARVTIKDNLPIVKFAFKVDDTGNLALNNCLNSNTVKQHYESLNLLTRFKDNCNTFLYEMINCLKIRSKDTKEKIKFYLSEEIMILEKTYGKNHWKPILVAGLVNSEEFCDWVLNSPNTEQTQ